jgi:hypothetical protein
MLSKQYQRHASLRYQNLFTAVVVSAEIPSGG